MRLCVAGFLLVTTAGFSQKLVPESCPNASFPLGAIAVVHPVDKTCAIDGKQTSPAPTRLQNSVKNNFCASGTPRIFTPQQLIDLQSQTHIPTGEGMEPQTRTAAQALGEGTVVRMAAFIIEAHYANIGTGESVNCDLKTQDGNDIHIALGPTANTPECSSVTAEISPHYRPTSWTNIGLFESFDTSTNQTVVNAAVKKRLQAQPFRITGQLFFDASHDPCPCGTSNCTPQRSSDWEIHPVYSIEACKPGAACDVNQDADWIAFDTWWNSSSAKPKSPK